MGYLEYRYADDTFSLGWEMMFSLRDLPVAGLSSLKVGIVDVIPKLKLFSIKQFCWEKNGLAESNLLTLQFFYPIFQYLYPAHPVSLLFLFFHVLR